MGTLLLKFTINLERRDLGEFPPAGPLFHRWLPDGKHDAIVIHDAESHATLKMWFERWGVVRDSFIQFAYNRKEVDPEIVPRQAVLDAGPLLGEIVIDVSPDELEAIVQNRLGDPHYVALGKKVVKSVIKKHAARLLRILKTTYGQYWISIPEEWDSRKLSLGQHCRLLGMAWSVDNGLRWSPFEPDEPEYKITIDMPDNRFQELLSKKDWGFLQELLQSGYDTSFAGALLARVHELFDQQNLRHALIEATTALEVAIEQFFREKVGGYLDIQNALQSYWELPLRTRLTAVALAGSQISLDDVQHAVAAIELRNKVVHEGIEPPREADVKIEGLLRAVGGLLFGPRVRFPLMHPGNELRKTAEDWEKDGSSPNPV